MNLSKSSIKVAIKYIKIIGVLCVATNILAADVLDRSLLFPLKRQYSSCGVDATYIYLSSIGQERTYQNIAHSYDKKDDQAMTLKEIYDYLTKIGLSVEAAKCDIQYLQELRKPAIVLCRPAYVSEGAVLHFAVVYYDSAKETFILADPQRSVHVISISPSVLKKLWLGVALYAKA